MTEKTVSCVLRIVAVVVVLIGVVWTMSTVLTLAYASQVMPIGNMFGMWLIVPLVVLGEGALLWQLSPAIARRVVA